MPIVYGAMLFFHRFPAAEPCEYPAFKISNRAARLYRERLGVALFRGVSHLAERRVLVIPCPLGLAAMAVLYFSFKFRDYRFPLLCLWCLVDCVPEFDLRGFLFQPPAIRYSSVNLILPPLAAGVVLFYHVYSSRLDPSLWIHRTLVVCACCAMIYMICTSIAVPLTVRTYIYDR